MKFLDNVKYGLTKGKNKCIKHSGDICTVLGAVGTVASVCFAVRQAFKTKDILEEADENIKKIDMVHEGAIEVEEPYTEEDYQNDITAVKTETVVKLVGTWLPVVATTSGSIFLNVKGYSIVKGRLIKTSAAYAGSVAAYKALKKGIIDKYGEDEFQELAHGVKKELITEHTVDENGNEITVEKEVTTANDVFSDYSVWWTKNCPGFINDDPAASEFQLRSMLQEVNNELRLRGFVTLAKCYEIFLGSNWANMLDDDPEIAAKKRKAALVVGWVYRKDGGNVNGDNYIDIGIYDLSKRIRPANHKAVTQAVLLDFNPDGLILDLI